ncbi:hypothetical protein GCM10011584_03760 [Nocardioides phosphati]|uniref:Peptidase M48 domain-containing protein n=1 Tax=Nocardioides phosphati TaxID=1867775 RepID=A0ABQ2N6U5_9ACTN|nr:M56 family metallopeptidase [Nocardioides phosphati]GGO84958.1 hypothetical protein GCM10011584_03760 [Nocardioides phosphati]
MITALILLAYASLVGVYGARLVNNAAWTRRAPRLAILFWQALAVSVLASVALAGLAVAFPMAPGAGQLADLLHTCVMLLRSRYASPGGAMVSSAGLLLAAGVALRMAWCFTVAVRDVAIRRTAQRDFVAILGEHVQDLSVDVVAHDRCAVYCVPGRRARVVVTSAALEALDDEQLTAVLAHERAHLRGRHDLVVLSLEVLRRAFAFVPLFKVAADEVAGLVEMVADDAAAARNDRVVLATALVRLASGTAPAGALGAGGAGALARVRRLVDDDGHRLGRGRTALLLASVLAVAALPLIMASAPALGIIAANYCPLSFHA